jgi:hypothetical protein
VATGAASTATLTAATASWSAQVLVPSGVAAAPGGRGYASATPRSRGTATSTPRGRGVAVALPADGYARTI